MKGIKENTVKLINELHRLRARYEQTTPPKNRRDREFFQMVKDETNPIYEQLEQWEQDALQMTKERKVQVHPQQIASTRENMELLLMHSYFIDARESRYMELYQSVLYIFNQLVDELENNYQGDDK